MSYDLECYCQNCGVEYTESVLVDSVCPTCGTNTEDWPPVYYECIHGARYMEQDSDLSWTGKDRECNCA
jgi:hypothetical protein